MEEAKTHKNGKNVKKERKTRGAQNIKIREKGERKNEREKKERNYLKARK